jgi:GH15 family glucan-1,4-alpha-glucosidase
VARYPNISDHGLIGDLQTAALVTTDGTLDWFCCPRFDSPSVFASLLDAERGGFYRIAPDREDYVSRQLYLPDTAILVTRFMIPDGVGEVDDFMPIAGATSTDRHRLVRNIRAILGATLMITQSFLYNAIFFTYALVLINFYHVPSAKVRCTGWRSPSATCAGRWSWGRCSTRGAASR